MITGYHAAVDPVALGRSVAALVGVHLSDTSDQDAVTVALQRLEEVEDCWFVAGDESFLIKVRVPDVPALERTLSRLRRIRGVARTRTTVVLSTKWEGRAAPQPDAEPSPRSCRPRRTTARAWLSRSSSSALVPSSTAARASIRRRRASSRTAPAGGGRGDQDPRGRSPRLAAHQAGGLQRVDDAGDGRAG